jgi:phosphinothricin acetyltransferase
MIRKVQLKDASELKDIYNHYILNSVISFELHAIDTNEMVKRIEKVYNTLPWIVYEENSKILGYAYAGKWKERSAYQQSVESSVYIKNDQQGRGIAFMLYFELIEQLKKINIHAIMGGIALPNEASIALHEKMGFEKVAHFKEVGYKFGRWIDVAYWQLLLNTDH